MKFFTILLILVSPFFIIYSKADSHMEEEKTIIIHTNKGDITLELDLEKAPITCENFIKLSQKKIPFFFNIVLY